MTILTTGVRSGLGRFLFEQLGGHAWTREMSDESIGELQSAGISTILHCAFNSATRVTTDSAYRYVDDNLLLTERLTRLPHSKFVFFSSVDVYPPHSHSCRADAEIELDEVKNLYGITKLASEAIIRARCPDHLILRCTSLLGPYSRTNSLIRILDDDPCALGLSGDSRLNYVRHEDLCELVRTAIADDLRGTLNVAAAESIALSRVAEIFQREVEFGDYRYVVGDVPNQELVAIAPTFAASSEVVVRAFAETRRHSATEPICAPPDGR